jgi:hypothetical protein
MRYANTLEMVNDQKQTQTLILPLPTYRGILTARAVGLLQSQHQTFYQEFRKILPIVLEILEL